MMIKFIISSMIVFYSGISSSQVLTIELSDHEYGLDEEKRILVCHISDIEHYENIAGYNEIKIAVDQDIFLFNTLPDGLQYTESYGITKIDQQDEYTLYFTELPIISIYSNSEILDEPKTKADFTYFDGIQVTTSKIGIELRGGSSISFPKKTYDLEFWEDDLGNETKNVKFGNLRKDDDWILDGLYNEPLRIRSYIANKLWLDLSSPYYLEKEPEARSGADVSYVEIFINGHYNGIYNLSEQVDKKQLKIKSYNGEIRGELYKGIGWGASTFSSHPLYDNNSRIWSGFELKYPDEEEVTDWSKLYDFVDFVIKAADSEFTTNIWSHFNVDNYSDYFMFLNLIRATDNTGKNIYLAKYNKEEPYFYVPWDLDGCFGTIYDGTRENITTDILSNGLIQRVNQLNPKNISPFIAQEWFKKRDNIFHIDSLTKRIKDQYNFLQNNKIYERESTVYANYLYDQEDLTYLLEWLKRRLLYLDGYYNDIISNNNNISKEVIFSIFPNPTNNNIYIKSLESVIGIKYKISNLNGKIVKMGKCMESHIAINDLNNGMYLLTLKNHKSVLFVKK